ncbi:4-hydroxybenzoate octaprenyltransferase [Thalassospira sp.]|uniref:4-hydroxybenzoate octaprenyltransferase n=1 Tax=Thalassospira sp. TaxID=1912094 RepID=UPI002736D361|nr:4-hydroxybenzoate octaprenyltransferase [Thalassospira sp.]MDP2699651.1 4-hydroxybenzoate octaprenyltransferase [Thalassospira sp.]
MAQVNQPLHTPKNDMPQDGWIDRFAPASVRPYLKLARLDRPIGTWLLLLPCWWATAMAANGAPDILMMVWFAIGAIIMRGAGCVVNDLADRNFDGRVERTATRPLPSGQVNVWQAMVFLGVLLLIGLLVLVQFRIEAIIVGICSLPLVITYPFMKRITYWPQAVLGLTFNWGALVGWAAVTGDVAPAAIVMYVAGFFWTLGYDTIYAHQDKEDDRKIGLKSLALRLGDATPQWVMGFYCVTTALLAISGGLAGMHWVYFPLLAVACLHLVWQVRTVQIDNAANCLKRFKSNRDFGLLVLAAIVIAGLAR